MEKLYLKLFVLLFVIAGQLDGNAQNLLFAKRLGSNSLGTNSDQINAISLDDVGDFYVTGTNGKGTSGAIFSLQDTLKLDGSFLAKYSKSGNLYWVRPMGDSIHGIRSYAVKPDHSGNVYVSGMFYQQAVFGNGQANEKKLEGDSGEIFIAKYNSNGNFLWAINIGGTGDDNPGGKSLAVDKSGNVYVVGSFYGSVVFGKGSSRQTTLSGEKLDIFIAKYNSSGALQWATKAGGPSNDGAKSIAIDKDDNLVITGNYFDYAVFGKGLTNETILDDNNESAFIAKYNKDGKFLWAISPFLSNNADISGDIKLDTLGSIYFTGSFVKTITVGKNTSKEAQLSSTGDEDIILSKYNASGEFLWAKIAGSTANDRGTSIALDSCFNLFVTGYYSNLVKFGNAERNMQTLSNSGSADVFVAKFSNSGEFIWATSCGGSGWDEAVSIDVDKDGRSFVVGNYTRSLTLGRKQARETTLPIEGLSDIFIAQFEKSYNRQPEFEVKGNTEFLEDFIGTQRITVNQIHTPTDELQQQVTYSIQPTTVDFITVQFNSSTGVIELAAKENKFGEATFTIKADDGSKENNLYSKNIKITVQPVNDKPVIKAYTGATSIDANTFLKIKLTDISVIDPDNDYPKDFTLKLSEGENYTLSVDSIKPVKDYKGEISVAVTVNDGQLDSDKFTFIVKINEVINPIATSAYAVYPNPTINQIQIKFKQATEHRVILYSSSGKIYYSATTDNPYYTIDISSFDDGIYLLHIIFGETREVTKLIKSSAG